MGNLESALKTYVDRIVDEAVLRLLPGAVERDLRERKLLIG
jgi:hypothetical protein